MRRKKGITLIGMPGCGKSTVGEALASQLGWKFVDLDTLIFEKAGRTHTQILREQGSRGPSTLLYLENKYTLELALDQLVFSPGGSIVYCTEAMHRLSRETCIVYLSASLKIITERLGDISGNDRGIVGLEKGLPKLFAERTKIFKRYAHFTIECGGKDIGTIVEGLIPLAPKE